ncbi:MAG: AMP-dependent synthetase/ligase [Candidatus Sumerlaeaceae bacterium]
MPQRTIPQFFFEAAQRHANVVALDNPHGNPPDKLTYAQLAAQARSFGAGLAASGIAPGERIAFFSDNRPRWMIADLGMLGMGTVDVPRGSDTSTAEFEFIMKHSGTTAAVLQDKYIYDRLSNSEIMKAVKLVVLMDDSAPADAPASVINFSAIQQRGDSNLEQFDALSAKVTPSTLATIVYTSGTTGSPKGVMLTHGNLAHQPDGVDLGTTAMPGEIVLSILPTWHAYERAVEYYALRHGATLVYSDKRFLKKDMEEMRPHLMPCVPRIWESVYDAIQDKVRKSPPARQKLFAFFTRVGSRYIHAKRVATATDVRRTPAGAAEKAQAIAAMVALAPAYELGDALVFSRLRAVTGGRMRAAVSGGGSLAAYLDDFFEMVGVPILNGYGLTETAPVLCNRRTTHNVRGTVGLPMPETEIQVRDDPGNLLPQGTAGIIFARGPQVMSGYYNNVEATAKVLSEDGWFNTGDLGWIAASGDLVISGRAKDTIVLVGGENVEPEPIEDAARKSPLIQQIVCVGQDQKTVGALVVPNYAALAVAIGLPDNTSATEVAASPQAVKAVREAIKSAMAAEATFKPSDHISKVALLSEPFSEDNGMLTQTLKIKRNVVANHYEKLIADLFS